MRLRALVALAGFLLSPVATAADEPGAAVAPAAVEVESDGKLAAAVEVDRSEVKLGEPVWLTIRIRGQSGSTDSTTIDLPDSPDLGPFVELARETRADAVAGQSIRVLRLKLACFDELGDLEVPGLALVSRGDGGDGPGIETPPIKIKVLSILEGIEEPKPRDVAGPVDVFVPDYRALVVAGGVLVWLLVGLLFRRRRAGLDVSERFQDLPPPRLAHEIAMEKLEQIVGDDLLRQGKIHTYFTRISETVREYLGNRYGFFALDLTSRELLEEIRDRMTPGLDLASLDGLLAESDRVKFARHQPDDASCSSAIDDAHGLVEATRVQDEPEGG